jgi:hypothetical protein
VKLIEIINSVIERDALDERLRCLNELQTYLQTNVELKNKYNEFRQYEVLNNLDQLYTHQGNRVVIMTFGSTHFDKNGPLEDFSTQMIKKGVNHKIISINSDISE